MLILELAIGAAFGGLLYGTWKIGALRRIYSGLLGGVDRLSEKIKDPVAELKLKHLEVLDRAKRAAELYEKIGGEIARLEKKAEILRSELEDLKSSYNTDLEKARERYGEELPFEVAKSFLNRKHLIELKEKHLEMINRKLEKLNKTKEKIGHNLQKLNEQAKILYEYIEQLKLQRDHADIQRKEFETVLTADVEIDFDGIHREIEMVVAEAEGKEKAREEMAEILRSESPNDSIRVEDLRV